MASAVEFPIRRKLILLLCASAWLVVAVQLALAIPLFREDKTILLYEMTSSTVKTLAAQVDALVGAWNSKASMAQSSDAAKLLAADPDALALLSPSGDIKWSRIPQKIAQAAAAEAKKFKSTGAALRALSLTDLQQVGALEVGSGDAGSWLLLVNLGRFSKVLEGPGGSGERAILDDQGHLIAGSWSGADSLQGHPLLTAAASESSVRSQTQQYKWKERDWIGAFSRVPAGGLWVISQTPSKEAFRASYQLIERTVWIALILATAAILVAALFSKSLTDPLNALVAATERVARGEWQTSLHIKSRDEVGKLAAAFNAMASDLRTGKEQISRTETEVSRQVKERTETLETQKKSASEAQEALVRTTRLASLGELAGVAAHEILNPVNNIGIRVQKMQGPSVQLDDADAKLAHEIVSAWEKAFTEGGWEKLKQELSRVSDKTQIPLLQEDLNNLKGIAQDFVKRTQERKTDFEFLSKELTRVTRIVNNMRALSRVGGERRPLDVHTALQDTQAATQEFLAKRSIEWISEFSGDPRALFSILGDKDELVQVFSNLVRNAAQAVAAAQRRKGWVKVSTQRGPNRVEVRITDNGTGISPANKTKLFDTPFTTKNAQEGTGLGLSISRRIVRAFGGDIEIEATQEGEGTTFLIWFPQAQEAGS